MNRIATPVTVVGLGSMGHALAATLVEAGHPTTVWNRTPDKATALVSAGATLAPDVSPAVAAGPLVVFCLLDTPAVLDLLADAGDAVRGRVVVNLTTGTPDDARRIAHQVAEQGGEYVDGAMMAVPAMVGRPEAMFLYGGSRRAFDAHEATLRVLAPASAFVGDDAGAAALHDMALLALLYADMVGWLQAYALVRAGGVDATAFQPYAQAWFTNVVAAEDGLHVAADVDARRYPDTVGSNLALNAKGLALVARAYAESGVNGEMFDAFARLADKRVADGHGADGFTGLVEALT